jgi:hypothetical protein
MRRGQIYDHSDDQVFGEVLLSGGTLTVLDAQIEALVDGQRRRLTWFMSESGRPEPTDEQLFDHLVTWSNGYVGGREVD